MLFEDYLEQLQQLLLEYPEAAKLEVITSADDEGNYFNRVFYGPSIGVFKNDEFDRVLNPKEANCICLN